jgi:hypothetical protein
LRRMEIGHSAELEVGVLISQSWGIALMLIRVTRAPSSLTSKSPWLVNSQSNVGLTLKERSALSDSPRASSANGRLIGSVLLAEGLGLQPEIRSICQAIQGCGNYRLEVWKGVEPLSCPLRRYWSSRRQDAWSARAAAAPGSRRLNGRYATPTYPSRIPVTRLAALAHVRERQR